MTFIVEIASSPDRDDLVAEIWWNDQMVAELRRSPDGGRYIDLYPSPSRVPWSFSLDDWTKAVEEAKSQLG
ncbi:hypothetical protein K8B33_15085 [Alcanivorax sp. JB21]|uniref:hypothetical protein n=1 Tax=Alcanivorax limicola TaxID=2874102 RepID=UPI001CBFD069|nr:hypothetical protein [Alcanivorax limicola]MBZ2188658.1 hypothetical protein [Alcanivorax limicola]MBZ2190433.1 hypothetical protein [Alcanivorax limicola]